MNRLFSSRGRAFFTSACLLIAAAGLGLGASTLYSTMTGGSCCLPGAPCCYPGSPCCAHGDVADAR